MAASTAFSSAPPGFVELVTWYRLIAKADSPTICVGDQGAVDVRVHADVAGRLELGGWVRLPRAGPGDLPDVLIRGRTQGANVRLKETERITGLDGVDGANNAVFDFEAREAGDSQITFEVEERSITDFRLPGVLAAAEVSVPVKVVHCEFVLHAFSTFVLEGEAGLTFGTAMTNVELTQSDDGQLRQSVTVTWFAWAGQVGDCIGQLAANGSEAAVFGLVSEDGVLSIDVKYEPFHVQLSSNCGGFATDITPSALHFEVDSAGGSGSLDQKLTSTFGDVPGAAAWVVVPTDDT
jgi:hypothetical protein